ncbi:MAG: hypothetical protein F4Z73_01620, partial [Synechococcus sp. SB0668_bin_13]|nr:hypothetical protein [Synechococcus sp. SB0668_bin_13]
MDAASAPEGDSGATGYTFRVKLTEARSTHTPFTLCIDPSSSASLGTDFSLWSESWDYELSFGSDISVVTLPSNCAGVFVEPYRTQSWDYMIRVTGDESYEGGDETVVLKLGRLKSSSNMKTPDNVEISSTANTITHTIENDDHGVLVKPTSLSVLATKSVTYRMRLLSNPGGTVTVTPTSANANIATVSGPLTFDAANWQTEQSVTITGKTEGEAKITHTITAATNDYPISMTVEPVDVTVNALVKASLELVGTASAPEGDSGTTGYTFRVKLTEARSTHTHFTLCIDPSSSASEGTDFWLIGSSGKKMIVRPHRCTIAFVSPFRKQTRYKIRVKGDKVYEGDETVVVKLEQIGGRSTITTPDDVEISAAANTITHTIENDDHGVLVKPTSLSVLATKSVTYRMRLLSNPGGTVTVTPTSANANIATVSGPLTFDAANWQTEQSVTITGKTEGEAKITHTITAATNDYPISMTVEPVDVTVNVVKASLELVGAASAPEGDSGTKDYVFRVKLTEARSTGTHFTLCIDPSSSASEGTDFSLREANGKKLTKTSLDSNCTFVLIAPNKTQSEAYKIRVKGDE